MGRVAEDSPPGGSVVALDTMAFVYFLEHHPRHYATARALFDRIEAGQIDAVMATLTFAELLVPAFRAGDEARALAIRRTLDSFPNLRTIELSGEIAASAAQLRAHHGLRTPDAIHAATALAGGADGIVSNDRHMRCLEPDLAVWLFDQPGP